MPLEQRLTGDAEKLELLRSKPDVTKRLKKGKMAMIEQLMMMMTCCKLDSVQCLRISTV